MKSSIVTRLAAIALSAVFATMATFGVAMLITSSGQDGRMAVSAKASAPQGAEPANAELTRWEAPSAPASKQVL